MMIALRPLQPADTEDHLAGEDAELTEWLTGGAGIADTVRAHIERTQAMWAAGGPTFTFGIHTIVGDVLAGTLDVQLHQPYALQTQANLAFGLYRPWRGQGLAKRAVLLAIEFLRKHTHLEQALIRAHPTNHSSSAVARRTGFHRTNTPPEDTEELQWFVQHIR